MLDHIITGGRRLSLGLWAKKHKVDSVFVKSLYESIEDPDETPYLIDTVTKGFKKLPVTARNEVRNSLIRVQIHCSIHGNSDPIKLSKQLYIAQTLEKIMFGSNMLMDGIEEEEEIPLTKKVKGK